MGGWNVSSCLYESLIYVVVISTTGVQGGALFSFVYYLFLVSLYFDVFA